MKTRSYCRQVAIYGTSFIVLSQTVHAAAQPAPDRVELYSRAAGAITDAKPPVDPVADSETLTDPKARATRYSLARREAWLKTNAKGLALFQQALRTPLSPKRVQAGATKVLTHEYGDMRQLARYKMVEANTREMRGDWNGAVQSHLDIVQLGLDTGADGSLLSSLVTYAIDALGREDVDEASAHLNLAQTRAAIARLQGLYDRRLRLASMVAAEKKSGLKMLRDVVARPGWRKTDDSNWLTASQIADLKTVAPQTLLARYSAKMDRLVSDSRLPYRTVRALPPNEFREFDDVLVPGIAANAFIAARADTARALWLVSLALQAHKLEQGALPASLDALVPRYLARVPADPFSGTVPLRYRPTAKSYDLWSIGPDGVDNNGRPIRSGKPWAPYPGAKPLPARVYDKSTGDFVAGKNR